MTSSTEDVAVAASNSSATSTKQANADMDRMTQILLHEERSCIFETRVERADLCRQRGSAQFKIGNVDEAIKWYERALYHVDFDEGTWHFEFTPRNRADVNVVRLPVYLNLAACFLVQGAPKDGKQDEQILAKEI
ncbi:Tetratricopeptide TPR1 [Plasmopara halstedii]|uniref:Tetratricopeptide TPR1 n=1 Tax=Plasmopara halstedii TaxID=4781 RepID=A0A0P1AZB4_PLAHL|nr:Tetratricopeptide TPR1 [Plasmopara halstedii]CEG47783.1 Tetratricopeptide TPR1 [Plasmopara halstedii]|eukprot:XP_024584152.1 Tetratricopeptide TPR1 [Plasmopara halstedii]